MWPPITWSEGRVRKKQYRAIRLERPRFKKGIASRAITFDGYAIRTDGKEDSIFKHELSGLHWRNPATGKFEGRKGQELCNELVEAFERSVPIAASDLWLLMAHPEQAPTTSPGAKAEGRAVQAPVRQSARPPEPEPEPGGAAVSILEVEPGPPDQLIREQVRTCPSCGAELRAGVTFCGSCGARLAAQPEVAPLPEETRECPACGAEMALGLDFCEACGARLEVESTAVEARESPPPPGETTVEGVAAPAEEEPRKCPGCGEAVKADWKACPFCGESLAPASCPECGKPVESGWLVCPYCAAELQS